MMDSLMLEQFLFANLFLNWNYAFEYQFSCDILPLPHYDSRLEEGFALAWGEATPPYDLNP